MIFDDFILFYIDYNQYTINQSVPVPNVKISEVNTKQYQKPKKVGVNEADKYNHDVQDYDIYENQVWIHVPHNNGLNKIVKIVSLQLEGTIRMHLTMSFSYFRLSWTRTNSEFPTVNSLGKKINYDSNMILFYNWYLRLLKLHLDVYDVYHWILSLKSYHITFYFSPRLN